MAETTTTRLSLRRWSAGTDTPSRAEFDTNFANLENLTAIDKQDTFANRPAAGVRGTYFWDTTNGLLWRDTGSAWFSVGSSGRDALFKSSTDSSVPLTVDTLGAGQTGNLFEAKVNGTVKAAIDKDGKYTGGSSSSTNASFVNTAPATVVISAKGAASQSANLFELKNSGDANQFTVSPTGIVQSSFFRSGTNATINAASSTSVANMAFWSGTPVLEVKANGSGTFNDFIYLKHDVADGSAATRRLGLVMKAGAEDASGAARSAAIYLRSTSGLFDQPTLRMDVRDLNMWEMRPTVNEGSTTVYPVYASGAYFKATPSGTGGFSSSNTWIGTQNSGNAQYFRSGNTSNGFYWYAGGVHSDFAGTPGSGGALMASLLPDSTGEPTFTAARGVFTSGKDVDPASDEATLVLGPISGENMKLDGNEIACWNNSVPSTLSLQTADPAGDGILRLGNENTVVRINEVRLAMSTNGSLPDGGIYNVGDIWIDARVGQGVKVRNSSGVWVLTN